MSTMVSAADVSWQIQGDPVPSTADDLPFADRLEATDRARLDEALADGRVEGIAERISVVDVTYIDGTEEEMSLAEPIGGWLWCESTAADRTRQLLGVTLDEMRQRHERGKRRREEWKATRAVGIAALKRSMANILG